MSSFSIIFSIISIYSLIIIISIIFIMMMIIIVIVIVIVIVISVVFIPVIYCFLIFLFSVQFDFIYCQAITEKNTMKVLEKILGVMKIWNEIVS